MDLKQIKQNAFIDELEKIAKIKKEKKVNKKVPFGVRLGAAALGLGGLALIMKKKPHLMI